MLDTLEFHTPAFCATTHGFSLSNNKTMYCMCRYFNVKFDIYSLNNYALISI